MICHWEYDKNPIYVETQNFASLLQNRTGKRIQFSILTGPSNPESRNFLDIHGSKG
jgi:hypothetical protein